MNTEIRAIGFDWDGTLVDSVLIKARAFTDALSKVDSRFERHEEDLIAFYIENRGRPRHEQFSLVMDKYTYRRISNGLLDQLNRYFLQIYIPVKAPLFPETLGTLQVLNNAGYKLFLSSGMPADDLMLVYSQYTELHGLFTHVLGRSAEFRKGIEHFSLVSRQLGIPLSQMIFVGDAKEDIDAAIEAGVYPVLKSDESLQEMHTPFPLQIIASLGQIVDILLLVSDSIKSQEGARAQ